jgi:hypothetical protein
MANATLLKLASMFADTFEIGARKAERKKKDIAL